MKEFCLQGFYKGRCNLQQTACIFALTGHLLFLSACNTKPVNEKRLNQKELKKSLIEANKDLVAIENQDIENYVIRHKWKMVETGSGLHYMVYEKGTGRNVEEGMVVRYRSEVSLLTGKVCYTRKEREVKEFVVGRGGVESGLEEAVLHFREGDRAKIILPSHLAYGLLGDENCIPKKATIVYDIEIIAVLKLINQN